MKKFLYCTAAVFALSGIIFCGCTPTNDVTPDTPPVVDDTDVNGEEITDDPDTSIDGPIVTDDPNQGDDNPEVNIDTPPVTDVPNSPPPTSGKPVVDKELQPYWNSINEIAAAAQNYYSENFNKTRLVSQNGKLYDSTTNKEIDTVFLVAKGELSSKYKDYACDILLLKTEDVKKYSNVSLKNDGTGMAVFVVAKNPKADSYLLTTARSNGGIISNADYISLVSGYGQNHGSVGRLMSGTDEYNRIVNFLSMYEGKFDKYYVRSITKDNKYACVVLSNQKDVNDLKQYILKKDNNVWEVVMDKLENESRVNVAVNKKLPDFNPQLLPSYTIYDYKKLLISDYTGVLHFLAKDDYINSISEVKYIAGADKYCYVILNNEIKYMCFYNDDKWSVEQVSDYNDAYEFMTKKSVLAPTFILWDK